MPEYEVFPNAPVEEAIVTVRVPRLSVADLNAGLRRITAALDDHYPVCEGFGPTDDGDPLDPDAPGGVAYRLLSADRQQAVQLTPTSFSFHRLRPYTRWEAFAGGALAAWVAYKPAFAPPSIDQIELRYINLLQIPDGEDWREYLSIHPSLPPTVRRGLVDYLMSLSFRDLDVPGDAIVTQTRKPAIHGSGIIYDIDTKSLLKPDSPEDRSLWQILERLRDFKNRLFFEGLTERAMELFR